MVGMAEDALVSVQSQRVAGMTEHVLATEKATGSTTNGTYDLASTTTAASCD